MQSFRFRVIDGVAGLYRGGPKRATFRPGRRNSRAESGFIGDESKEDEMADSKQLPEGTDTIVSGAAVTSENEEQLIVAETRARDKVLEKVREGRGKLAEQAAGRTRGLVGQGLERSSEALANVSKLVGETAPGLDDRLGQEYGDYARKAANAIDDVANNLASKDPDELIDDVREFVSRSPGIALAGAAIVGFALARLVKNGLDRDRESRG
jgi:hypothetical protein